MPDQILQTKLTLPPVRARLVHRPQLLGRMNSCLNCKLMLVSAPAGFGKTTLVSEWVLESGRQSAWVSLDEADNDPVRFLMYLVAALRKIAPEFGEDILENLESLPSLSMEAHYIPLINEISEALPPLILVLDDFHAIHSPDVHSLITFLIENQPAHVRIVISTRADPPWPIARLRTAGEMVELRAADLRFEPGEVEIFLMDVMNLDLSQDDLEILNRRTEGWIAGLQMAALSIRGQQDASGYIRSFAGSHRFILDYLVEEVLSSLSKEIEQFLLTTSILKRMTGALCDSLTGREDGAETLNQLDQLNLFVISLDDDRCWFRYHHLFADLLYSRFEQLSPDLLPDLHRKASQWYEDAGYVEEAIEHAFSAGDQKLAARLVEHTATRMFFEGNISTLSRWLDKIPPDLIRSQPWLCIYHAWTQYWVGRRSRVEECLVFADEALAYSADRHPDHGELDLWTALADEEKEHITGYIAALRAYNAMGDMDIASRMAEKALELLPEGDPMLATTAMTMGEVYWAMGDVQAAEQAFAQARMYAQESGFQAIAVSSTCYQGLQQQKQGRLYEAASTYQMAYDLGRRPGGSHVYATGLAQVRLGKLHLEWNDIDKAQRYIKEGFQRCTRMGNVDFLVEALISQAELMLVKEDLSGASAVLRDALDLIEKHAVDPWLMTWTRDWWVRYQIQSGQIEAAARFIDKEFPTISIGQIAPASPDYLHDLPQILQARVLAFQGFDRRGGDMVDRENKLEQAAWLLETISESASKAGWVNEEIRTLVLKSLVLQKQGKLVDALDCISRALTLAEPGGYVRTFTEHWDQLLGLVGKLKVRGIADKYIDYLLDAVETTGPTDVSKVPTQGVNIPESLFVDPLSDREMEVLRLLATDLPVPEIAGELCIAPSTTRSHIKNIYSKMDVHSRLEAVIKAQKLNLL